MDNNINKVKAAIELIERHCEVIKADIASMSRYETLAHLPERSEEDIPKHDTVDLTDLIVMRIWAIHDISVKTAEGITPPDSDNIEEAKQPGV